MKIGIIGAGAMGSGIAQVASQNNHEVVISDNNEASLEVSKSKLAKVMARLVEKGRVSKTDSESIQNRIEYTTTLSDFSDCGLIIEAIVENIEIKKSVFRQVEEIVSDECIIATNTSSLSVASVAAACDRSERILGIHFFNPAPLMPLVEIIPAVQTSQATLEKAKTIIDSWKKVTVIAKDTPGFIVNRVARPFYSEALRIYEEGIADMVTIDWAMREIGGFRMGPFQLMDFIGNDVNYVVTETVWKSFYYDPRYQPSITQKRHSEAGWLGRKSGKGYYDYSEGAENATPNENPVLGKQIVDRIVAMLINEAADAVFWQVASQEDIDLAMTKGVNYPKGLLVWANEIGIPDCVSRMESLRDRYQDPRYKCSPLLKEMAKSGNQFLA